MDCFLEGFKNSINESDKRRLFPEYHLEIMNNFRKTLDLLLENEELYQSKITEENIRKIMIDSKELTLKILEYKLKYGLCYITLQEHIEFDINLTQIDRIFLKYIAYYHTIICLTICKFIEKI